MENMLVDIPAATAVAMQYYKIGNLIWICAQLLPIAFFLVLLFTGASARIQAWANKRTKSWLAEVVTYCVLLALIAFVVSLPFSYLTSYVVQHHFGLSNETFGMWIGDLVKGSAITLIIGTACTVVIYALIKKSPKRWWMYGSLLTIPFIVLAQLITPIWIEPLFHNFGPMKDKGLEKEILALAEKAGISGSRVYEVDMSQETKMLNAYVTGFGSSKRIVLWDTIIEKLSTDQLLFVMAHEMGHYVLHHVEKEMLWQFGLSVLTFYVLSFAPWFLKRYKKQWRIGALKEIGSLPLLLLMVQIVGLVTLPLMNGVSRYYEHQADEFGLEMTQNKKAAAEAFVKLQQQNLGNPNPGKLYIFMRATHPPLGQRITFCNEWEEK
jgi:STE24 endopeptidase